MSNYHELNIHMFDDGTVMLEFEDRLHGEDWHFGFDGGGDLQVQGPGYDEEPRWTDAGELVTELVKLALWLKENR